MKLQCENFTKVTKPTKLVKPHMRTILPRCKGTRPPCTWIFLPPFMQGMEAPCHNQLCLVMLPRQLQILLWKVLSKTSPELPLGSLLLLPHLLLSCPAQGTLSRTGDAEFPPGCEGRDVTAIIIWNWAAKYFIAQLSFQRLAGLDCALWEQLRVWKRSCIYISGVWWGEEEFRLGNNEGEMEWQTRIFTIPNCEQCGWWSMNWSWVLTEVHCSVWTLFVWILPCLWGSWHFEGFLKLLGTWYWSIFKIPWRKQRAVESPVLRGLQKKKVKSILF